MRNRLEKCHRRRRTNHCQKRKGAKHRGVFRKNKFPKVSEKPRRHSMRYLLKVITSLYALSHSSTVEGVEGFTSATYEELQQLGATCSPKDTCALFPQKEYDTLEHRYCECDLHCTRYKTCCVDSPYVSRDKELEGNVSYECFKMPRTGKSYFMVTKCPRGWNRTSKITHLCEEVRDSRDPFVLLPATRSGRTYKNFYCTVCHGADPREIKLWDIHARRSVRVHVDENYSRDLLDELVYDESVGKWGHMANTNGSIKFVPADIGLVRDEDTESGFRTCIPDLISDCDPEWKDGAIRNKCLSYMAAIYVSSKRENSRETSRILHYRNIHCAMCNFVSYECLKQCEISITG